jgi:hypothetical protein
LPDVFKQCYKPQFLMRIVFTFYAINASLVCFLLTLGLLLPLHERLDTYLSSLFSYTYLLFGPLLLLCSLISLFFLRSLCLYECTPDAILTDGGLSLLDLLMVLGSFAFSSAVTFLLTMQEALTQMQKGLRDERSIVYRLYSWYLTK